MQMTADRLLAKLDRCLESILSSHHIAACVISILLSPCSASNLDTLVLLKFLKPKPKPVTSTAAVNSTERDPLLRRSPPADSDASNSPSHHHHHHQVQFDFSLALWSLVIEIVSYTLMAATTSPLGFTITGMITSLGSGFSPAMQSVALELYTQRHKGKGHVESGRLFGAISVVNALRYVSVHLRYHSSINLAPQFVDLEPGTLWHHIHENRRDDAQGDILRQYSQPCTRICAVEYGAPSETECAPHCCHR